MSIYTPLIRTLLLNAVTATGAGGAVGDSGGVPSFQASVAGTGAVSATVDIQARNVASGAWNVVATLSPTGTTLAGAVGALTTRYMEYRANCTAISGTGATLSVAMGSGET